ncbi:hypothetical protein SAMN05518861_12867 [Mesorhizobium sp. YR577]|nr:hypothetical protein SAMN05518861_12867 [Mesorhizobium sp. YR577]
MKCPDKEKRRRFWENVAVDILLTLCIVLPIAKAVDILLKM